MIFAEVERQLAVVDHRQLDARTVFELFDEQLFFGADQRMEKPDFHGHSPQSSSSLGASARTKGLTPVTSSSEPHSAQGINSPSTVSSPRLTVPPHTGHSAMTHFLLKKFPARGYGRPRSDDSNNERPQKAGARLRPTGKKRRGKAYNLCRATSSRT